jgi:hypothetical protein
MKEKHNRRPMFVLVLGLVALALLGSLWAWRAREGCGTCGGVRDLAGGSSLAKVGAAYYAILLVAGAAFGPTRFLFGGILLASAAHLALLLLLIQRGVLCPPCIVTGLAAIAGAILSFVIDPSNLARAGVLMPLGAIGAHLALFWAGGIMSPILASSGNALPEPESIRTHPPRVGVARMTVFSRAGCPYCVELEEKVVPELQREFGKRLDIFREEAPGGIPTPTIVIGGAKGTVFPGLPPVEDLKAALRSAIEGERHEQALLPESR